MFAWFGVHMSSKGEQWRDCIISGGWQVLACEVLGAANGLVLVLRPVRTSSPPPFITLAPAGRALTGVIPAYDG